MIPIYVSTAVFLISLLSPIDAIGQVEEYSKVIGWLGDVAEIKNNK